MSTAWFDFVPAVFWRVFGIVMALVLLGFAVAIWVYGTLALGDIIGSLISAVIFSYMVHLWIIMGRESADAGGD